MGDPSVTLTYDNKYRLVVFLEKNSKNKKIDIDIIPNTWIFMDECSAIKYNLKQSSNGKSVFKETCLYQILKCKLYV